MIIADEVQPGFGRAASHFWGHLKLGFRPNIVTIGKPMANGHPVAAVMTSPGTMAAFRGAFSYFNTFGGNPVSAAAALAVLDVIRDEGLMERASATSAHVMGRLGRCGIRCWRGCGQTGCSSPPISLTRAALPGPSAPISWSGWWKRAC